MLYNYTIIYAINAKWIHAKKAYRLYALYFKVAARAKKDPINKRYGQSINNEPGQKKKAYRLYALYFKVAARAKKDPINKRYGQSINNEPGQKKKAYRLYALYFKVAARAKKAIKKGLSPFFYSSSFNGI